MGLLSFMIKKGKLNYKVLLNLALHVHSIPPNFDLRQNGWKIKTTFPSVFKDVKVMRFSFFGGRFGREVSLFHVILSNIVGRFNIHFVPPFPIVKESHFYNQMLL